MTDEVRALLSRATRYLDSAALLREDGDLASCVSRAYYAMFFAAQAALLGEGVSVSTHRGVISEFGRRFIQTGRLDRSLGRALSDALQKRQVSDYEASPGITHEDAQKVLQQGRHFVEAVEDVLG